MLNYRSTVHTMIDVEKGSSTVSVMRYSDGNYRVTYTERVHPELDAEFDTNDYNKVNTFTEAHIEICEIISKECGLYIPINKEEAA